MTTHSETAGDALSALAGRRTVLVVDDEKSVRELIAVILELEGHRVLQADCGAVALDVAAAEELHLITLDVMMPDLDGWQVADALDASERTASVPRMMVSGKPMTELESAPGRSRASAVLSKPFDFAEFAEVVRRLLDGPVTVPRQRVDADIPVKRPASRID
jgi:CheY-like chemotaxis protein